MKSKQQSLLPPAHYFTLIIINYHSSDYVAQCLESILKFENHHFNWDVVILENGSPNQKNEIKNLKKKISELTKKYKFRPARFKLLISPTNLGFGGGNNFAAQQATGNLLLFLNGDTIFTEPILQKIEKHLLTKAKTISDYSECIEKPNNDYPLILAPQILLENSQPQAFAFGNFPTLGNLLTQSEKSYWGKYQPPTVDSEPFSVGWVTGAAFVIDKFAFEKIGGFDEDFFMYYEDIDLCYRLAETFGSNRIQILPSAEIIHLGGKSIALNRDRQKLYFASQDFYFAKHFPVWQTRLLQMIRLPYQLSRLNQK